jgi:hypothetical protein
VNQVRIDSKTMAAVEPPAEATTGADDALSVAVVLCTVLIGCSLIGCSGDHAGGRSDPAAIHAAGSAPVPEGPISPTARLETVQMLHGDLGAERHPSDGAGRAWIETDEAGPVEVEAGSRARFEVVFEAGPLGVAEGGTVFLQPSPFWGWSTPQVTDPDRPGYTTVATSATGVALSPQTIDRQLLAITIGGRRLEAGERVEMVYGAGAAGAGVDRHAEDGSRIWVAVDGDGDGVRAVIADSPTVNVLAGPAARLVLTLPSVARPGETVDLVVAILDARANAGVDFAGEVELVTDAEGVELRPRVRLGPADSGHCRLAITVAGEGIVRIRGRVNGLEAWSNPLQVSSHGPRIFWGDLHGHSQLSDGTATPEQYLGFARDVAALDVIALTDHDHWGVLFLDTHPNLWRDIRAAIRRFHRPGRFVALIGYEWTSWIHGHRHVLFFDDDGPVLSSMDARFDSPQELWQGLEGRSAMTIAHHSGGGPIATNWEIPPDPDLEPVTEVSSVHGSSEAGDTPRLIYSPVAGNFVRDALDRGYRLGFVGGGDSHDGHPGLAHLTTPSGGLTAFVMDELNRDAVARALRSRRVYATNGPRILLRMALDGRPMGSILEAGPDGLASVDLVVIAVTPAPIERVDVIRSGEVVASIDAEDRRRLSFSLEIEGLVAGEYVYARVVQGDGGAAWASPIFITAETK